MHQQHYFQIYILISKRKHIIIKSNFMKCSIFPSKECNFIHSTMLSKHICSLTFCIETTFFPEYHIKQINNLQLKPHVIQYYDKLPCCCHELDCGIILSDHSCYWVFHTKSISSFYTNYELSINKKCIKQYCNNLDMLSNTKFW